MGEKLPKPCTVINQPKEFTSRSTRAEFKILALFFYNNGVGRRRRKKSRGEKEREREREGEKEGGRVLALNPSSVTLCKFLNLLEPQFLCFFKKGK